VPVIDERPPSTDVDLASATATELVSRLEARQVSSRELLDAQLDRIERLDPAINAVVALDVDRARQRAGSIDHARARGDQVGPLAGLPMTIKDSFETEGLVTTAGAGELAEHVPARDADAVARLRGAGAVVFGKTNLPLYAGDWQTYNRVHGRTNNPWDVERTAGGSSGGAAAAVAAGFSTLELCSDIGGSIRVPAHYCGVFGHKPTWGAVPQRGHIPGPPGTLADADLGVMGPIGRSVADLQLGLDVLVGDDLGGVPGGRLPDASPAVASLDGCRVGVWLENDVVPTSRDVLDVLRSLVDALGDAGAAIDEHTRPSTPVMTGVHLYDQLLMSVLGTGFPAESLTAMNELATTSAEDDDSEAVRIARAVTLSHRGWLAANEQRHRIAAEWDEVFEAIDVLVAPVSPVTAFHHDTERPIEQRRLDVDGQLVPYRSHLVWSGLATVPLLPATVVPAGRAPSGLPVGVQIIGPRWGDRTTLAFGVLVERLIGGFVPPPLTSR